MFSWCFKCQTADDDNEYHQRPKTRNSSSITTTTTTTVGPQKNQHTAVSNAENDDVNVAEKSVEQMQKECLEAHNRYRAKHGVSPLTLNKQLNAYATEWAKVSLHKKATERCKNETKNKQDERQTIDRLADTHIRGFILGQGVIINNGCFYIFKICVFSN